MITPLRKRHRWMAPGSFLVAICGLGLGVASRPSASGTPLNSIDRTAWEETADLGSATWIEHDSGRFRAVVTGDRAVWLVPKEALDIPDLLVYSTAAEHVGDALPQDARLLGPASQGSPTRFEWPAGAKVLLLFSLGHQSIEASISLEGL